MPTLSQTSDFSRKTFIKVSIALGVLLSLFVLWTIGNFVKNSIFPPKPLPATVAFGQLPKLDLSEGVKPPPGISYNVETISGQLPQLISKAKVFGLSVEESSFGQLERTKNMVARIGFTAEPQNLDLHWFKFTDPKDNLRTITINTSSANFEFTSNFTQDIRVISSRPRSINDAKQAAVNFFKNFDFDSVDFPVEKTRTRTLRIDGNNLTETPALVNANLIEVNFERREIAKIPLVTARENSPSVQALVSLNSVVLASLTKQQIEKHNFATYPLKGTAKAFEDLKGGNSVFNKDVFDQTSFPIRDVTLAYMETKISQGFLQPVYVFKSDKGLIAYVSAVDESWTR